MQNIFQYGGYLYDKHKYGFGLLAKTLQSLFWLQGKNDSIFFIGFN